MRHVVLTVFCKICTTTENEIYLTKMDLLSVIYKNFHMLLLSRRDITFQFIYFITISSGPFCHGPVKNC